VVFESTVRLVYKPRPVEIEAVLNDFLAALMREGAPVGFRVTGVLPRGAYGWMEYVAHAPSRDQREATSYYERLGALLAVLYAVQATDVHAGNLVASGEYPSASTTSV
jgi:lantibiotic modifying enzyme